jgi:serine/threonine protein kinase
MPNKSLDAFIFDSKQETPINWEQRLHIINGLAQGLLYLHKYSRLKVIHRDLKTSNILLDSDMTPKIADFGMARIFWDNESMAKTAKIAGTYGYMAPEYAIRGIFSTKSDVFSFGVILLEIVCGRKNTSFGNDDGSVYLLAHAWELWTAGRSVELFDQRVAATYCMKEAVLCIQLGLLCIQDNPDDRPSMSDVIFILSQEETVLPAPKAPALFANLKYSDVDTSRTTSSMNDVTFTTMDGR